MIISIATFVLVFVMIVLVDSMVVKVLVTMMPVVQTMAVSDRKMSFFFLLWLFLLLELIKDSGRFVGSLALLQKSHKSKRVRGHHFVCLCELKLMHFWLREKDVFHFFLCCGKLHYLMEESTVEIAEELHLALHEFMHWHECGLLGNAKPTNQLVANVWEPGNCLKVIPDALVKVFLCEVPMIGALLAHNVGPLYENNILKTLTHQAEQCWTIFLLGFGKLSEDL